MKKLIFIMYLQRIIWILSLINFIQPQTIIDGNYHQGETKFKNHNLSIGIFDDRIGLSLIGYTYNIKLNEMNNFYLGGGTSIVAHTISGGLKHYYKKSNLSIYSVFSLKKMFMDNESSGTGEFTTVTASFSLEYNLSNWTQINLGGVGVLDDAEGNYEFWGYPFMGFNFRF